MDRGETIRLSRFSGGYEPDPLSPRKIETLSWPGPPHPAAIPDLLAFSQKLFDDEELLDVNKNLMPEKVLQEITKIEKKSAMAHAVLTELKVKQRPPQLSLDPWKASRSPDAKVEPTKRTRFKSPVNASISRVVRQPRPSSMATNRYSEGNSQLFSPPRNGVDFGMTSAATASYFTDSGIMSPTSPFSPQHSLTSYMSPMSPTKPYPQPYHYHIQQPRVAQRSSVLNESYLKRNNYINSSNRVITLPSARKSGVNNIVYNMAVPKPGYGLSRPNRNLTVPNSTRYGGLTSQMNEGLDTPSTISTTFNRQSRDRQLSPTRASYKQKPEKNDTERISDSKLYRAVLRMIV